MTRPGAPEDDPGDAREPVPEVGRAEREVGAAGAGLRLLVRPPGAART
jgi:hypothetical protein